MKRFIVGVGLSAIAAAVSAQSSVSISGVLKIEAARGNGGTSPLDNPMPSRWAVNDLSSAIIFTGKEDLGGGLYAGFELASFIGLDKGSSWADTGGPFWSRRSVVKLGGSFGEIYAGRSLTPQQLMALLSDPWYWDGSAAQVGWGIQQANYTSTSYIRTNNTVGYVSPSVAGFTLSLAAAAGEGVKSKDLGGSLTYSAGPLWLGIAFDQSHGFFNDPTRNRVTTLVGAYDFGVVRPVASFSTSRVNGVSYRSYSLAATAPVGANGLVKAQYSNLNDFDTVAPGRQGLNRLGLGYQHNLSKRTNLFAHLSQSKADGLSATNVAEFGIEHSF